MDGKRIGRFALLPSGGVSQLVTDGQVTSTHVPGIALLDQFETSACYQLVTDQDCPFEETFHFILLDRDLHVCARRSLGAAFSFVPGN
jgi:hypothetical protein